MALPLPKIKLAFRITAVALGFFQAWASRFFIEPDGINYLDIATAYLRRDWSNAVNAYWSPMYSWLLAVVQVIFHPSRYWESTFLHLLNFLLFLFALVSFEFFLGRLIALARFLSSETGGSGDIPEWAWWVLGYAAFLVCGLRVITLSTDTPDMALAAVVFLGIGVLIDTVQFRRGFLHYALLGAILGAGYLTKSVMLPMFFVCLVVVIFASGGVAKPNPRALATLAGFLLVSLPFAMALTRAKGYFTFGETGKVAYIHEVLHANEREFDQVNALTRSDGSIAGNDLAHRPRKLFANPDVFLYVTSFSSSTYPAWYDGGYWWEGRRPQFLPRDQLGALGRAGTAYFRMLSTEKQWVAGWLVLAIFAGDWKMTWARISRLWFVWVPPLAALGLYSLVLAEPRYVAVWVTVVWLVLFAAVPWSRVDGGRNLGAAVSLAIAITTGTAVVKDGLSNVAACLRPARHDQWEVAQGLLQMGLAPGEQVAFLGHTTVADYWACLIRLRVTADIPLESMQSYWLATPEIRREIASRLRANGIRALVTGTAPLVPEAWRQIGDTGYYVQILEPAVFATPNSGATH